MSKNYITKLDYRYIEQTKAIKEICKELGLIAFYPNYHGDKQDNNTVLIYTPEAHEYNKTLPEWSRQEDYKPYICWFENTDTNGHFDLNWMNRGKIDLRGLNSEHTKIREYILSKVKGDR